MGCWLKHKSESQERMILILILILPLLVAHSRHYSKSPNLSVPEDNTYSPLAFGILN